MTNKKHKWLSYKDAISSKLFINNECVWYVGDSWDEKQKPILVDTSFLEIYDLIYCDGFFMASDITPPPAPVLKLLENEQ